MLPRTLALTTIVAIAALSLISTPQLSAVGPRQFGSVDIYTNRGGQGPNNHGGSFTVGQTIVIYLYSSFDGVGTIIDQEPDGNTYNFGPFNMIGGRTYSFSSTASNPPGRSTLTLQVCTSGGYTTYPTAFFASPVAGSDPQPNQQNFGPLQSCASDTTWIDVAGSPANIYVSNCWVSPQNPLQEDQVTFYATVGNSGGSDASNVQINAYLDGNLFSSERDNIPANSQGTWHSNNQWIAQDGQHTLRVVANIPVAYAIQSIQGPNHPFASNEAYCTFYVRPHTIRVTYTQTVVSTITQNQWTTQTEQVQNTVTNTINTQTTVQRTLTANPSLTTTTLTGVSITTLYSPTITITITATAQVISNPFTWLTVLALGTALFRIQFPSTEGRKLRYLAKLVLQVVSSKRLRRSIFAVSLIGLSVLSVATIALRTGNASTITLTTWQTQTRYTTETRWLTTTMYRTNTKTEASTLVSTDVRYSTITPTSTVTIDERSASTLYLPTTITKTATKNLKSCDSSSIDPAHHYFQTDSMHFRICYQDGISDIYVQKVVVSADASYDTYRQYGFMMPPDKEWTIWIVEERGQVDFAKLCGNPDAWGCVPLPPAAGRHWILINWEALLGSYSGLHLVAHEIAHVVSYLYIKGILGELKASITLPSWAIEGFAEYAGFLVSKDDQQSLTLVPQQPEERDLIDCYKSTKGEQCYAVAYSFFKFVSDKYGGVETIKNALVAYADPWNIWRPLETAFERATNVNFDVLKREWQQWDFFAFSPIHSSFRVTVVGNTIEMNLDYLNPGHYDFIVRFEISVASTGRIVDSPTATVSYESGAGTVTAVSKSLGLGTYRISWWVFFAQDTNFVNPIVWSTSTETKTVVVS